MTLTYKAIRERLDLDHIKNYAVYARRLVEEHHVAGVKVTPQDGTLYTIIVSRPWTDGAGNRSPEYNVTLVGLGGSYPWHGSPLDESYVEEKWVPSGNKWTITVLTEFLNQFAQAGRYEHP